VIHEVGETAPASENVNRVLISILEFMKIDSPSELGDYVEGRQKYQSFAVKSNKIERLVCGGEKRDLAVDWHQ
jgi:hypothetical protein